MCRRRSGDSEIDRRANFFPRRAFAAPPIGQPRPAPYIEAMESTRPKLVIRNSETRDAAAIARLTRSEEHTSELQSLMRISYAVFCLKKKKTEQPTYTTLYQREHT